MPNPNQASQHPNQANTKTYAHTHTHTHYLTDTWLVKPNQFAKVEFQIMSTNPFGHPTPNTVQSPTWTQEIERTPSCTLIGNKLFGVKQSIAMQQHKHNNNNNTNEWGLPAMRKPWQRNRPPCSSLSPKSNPILVPSSPVLWVTNNQLLSWLWQFAWMELNRLLKGTETRPAPVQHFVESRLRTDPLLSNCVAGQYNGWWAQFPWPFQASGIVWIQQVSLHFSWCRSHLPQSGSP